MTPIRPLPVLLALLAAPAVARAQENDRRPLFELGIGGGGAWIPDYPAADQNRLRGIPFPYLVHRGEILRADDRGLRTDVYRGSALEFSFAFSGAFPVSSEDNRAREGMPDLDWLGEVGPGLRYTVWTGTPAPGRRPDRRLLLELPVRAVFSTDLTSIRFRGLTAEPNIVFEQRGLFLRDSRLRLSLGPIFGTERFQDYFYEVAPEFARPGRPAYDARGGYLGTRLQLSYRLPLSDSISFVAGGRVENFTGAANRDSPLFRREVNYTLAAGFAWSLYKSGSTVAAGIGPLD